MAIIVKYDKPIDNTLALDSVLPISNRNIDRIAHTYGTVSGTVAPDASYPTGGWTVPNAKFGLSQVAGVFFESSGGYTFMYNRATDKIQAYTTAATEVVNATNLSTLQAIYFKAEGLV